MSLYYFVILATQGSYGFQDFVRRLLCLMGDTFLFQMMRSSFNISFSTQFHITKCSYSKETKVGWCTSHLSNTGFGIQTGTQHIPKDATILEDKLFLIVPGRLNPKQMLGHAISTFSRRTTRNYRSGGRTNNLSTSVIGCPPKKTQKRRKAIYKTNLHAGSAW